MLPDISSSRPWSSDFRDLVGHPRYAIVDHFLDYFEEFALALIILAAVSLGRLPVQIVHRGQLLPTQGSSSALYRKPEPASHAISPSMRMR